MKRYDIPLLEDFPSTERNCGNCTRKGGGCVRLEKRFPLGLVKSSVTSDIGGVIYCCSHYTGQFDFRNLFFDFNCNFAP